MGAHLDEHLARLEPSGPEKGVTDSALVGEDDAGPSLAIKSLDEALNSQHFVSPRKVSTSAAVCIPGEREFPQRVAGHIPLHWDRP
jgi:hypothetical protein